MDDIYHVAEVFTYLIAEVNPLIDKANTFDILLEAFNEGLTKRSAKKYGKLIHKTIQIRDIHGKKTH